MTWLRTLGSRFLALFRKQRLEEELDRELRFHLEMETEENLRRGMSPEEARRAARWSFGGVEQTKEAWRDRRGLPRVEEWLRDLRFAARMLARSPGFAAFAVLSLALGIGANTAIFTVVRALVLRPLPYPEPEGLVKLWESFTWQGQSGAHGTVSVANLVDWREQNQVFEELAAFRPEGATLTRGENTLRVLATYVEGGVFRIMRVKPLLGRTFLPEEDTPGRDRVAVLSHGLWERVFGAKPGIIGEKIQIDGAAHTVVGVMPHGFQFPPRSGTELWTPLVFSARLRAERGSHWLEVIARLKPGVSWGTAQLNMNAIARRLAKQYPDTNATRGVTVQPLHLETVRATAQILRVLNRFDLGFQTERVLTIKLALPGIRYSEPQEAVAFFEGLLEEVRAIPGVSSAGLINYLPIQSWRETSNFTIQGRETPPPGHEPAADLRRVSVGYFQAMGIPLLAGRYLRPDDTAGRRPVALISRLTAERYFPNENPVGRSIRFGIRFEEGDWKTIVGIVGDVRDRGVYRPAPTVIYESYSQPDWPQKFMSLVLRASLDPETLTGALRRLVRNRDPDAVVFLVRTMEQVVSDSVSGTRLLSRLLTIFSLLALVLAVVGVYGVMSYLVSQRTHEIGVRMALGAGRREVVRLVLARGLRNALAGAVLGLMLAAMVSVAMRRFVIGIGVVDVWTYLSAVLGILAVVLVASGWPAWRASRVDPLVALHNE